MAATETPKRHRISIDAEEASCVGDALAHYLASSADNFGAGYADLDEEDRRQLQYERALVGEFASRLERLGR